MRLGLVPAKYPYGPKEPYLDVELRAIAPRLERVVVVPASPATRRRGYRDVPARVYRRPVFGLATLAAAFCETLARPKAVASALVALVREPQPVRTRLKNLAVVPKALALARIARHERLDHLHAYWLSTPATIAWLAARIAGIGFSATAHRWDIYEDNLGARKIADATFVRAISERGRTDLRARARYGGGERIELVRVGVKVPANAAPPSVAPGLRILCAAALVPVKGHGVLIDALAELRSRGVAFACTLAGDGPLRADLAAAIARAGLEDAVVLAGHVPHDRLVAQVQRGDYDCAVLASVEAAGNLMEGVPVALLEALAAGIPCVATSSGSIGDVIDDTVGALVPPGDAVALADALERLARDPAQRRRAGLAGRARIAAAWEIGATSAALVDALTRGVRPGTPGYTSADAPSLPTEMANG